jgi:fructose-bisphosphate aldolase class I
MDLNEGNIVKTASELITGGKGILASDETPSTLTRRFDALGIPSTPDTRRAYREVLFTAPGAENFISGVILQEETIRQRSSTGALLIDVLAGRGILPGIKVDVGAKRLAGFPDESITEGLDGLRDRLKEFRQMGARFAKWRAVIRIDEVLPSAACVRANAHALARYAGLCQEVGLCPIVEPEVLMDGAHPIERCEDVTGSVLQQTFDALFEQRILLEGMLLKPNMVLSGRKCALQANVEQVAWSTLRCLRRHVPAAVPGIVFLSGGQSPLEATHHLNEINRTDAAKPWELSFSFGRALQDEALRAWRGNQEKIREAQAAFLHRAMCVSAAASGKYVSSMDSEVESEAAA